MLNSIVISSNMTIEEAAGKIALLPKDRMLKISVKKGEIVGVKYLHIRSSGKAENLAMRMVSSNSKHNRIKALEVIADISNKYTVAEINQMPISVSELKRLVGAIRYEVPLENVEKALNKPRSLLKRIDSQITRLNNKFFAPKKLGKGIDF